MDRNQSSWQTLKVRARFENIVTANLTSQGLSAFFPPYVATRVRDGRTRSIQLPLFPGYVFCRMTRAQKPGALMTPGVLYVATKCAAEDPIVENEIAALKAVIRSPLHYEAGPLMTSGLRVQVIDG